jgi:MarR family transcriptional regulator, organic hydroperoxide resistance regulator
VEELRVPNRQLASDCPSNGVSAVAKRRSPKKATSALEHISFAIARAYYNHLGMLERILVEMGLAEHVRPGMGSVLFALFERDDQAIKEIVERSGLSHSTLSGLLRRMKRGGLIHLERDAADGRSIRVRLTPLGKSLQPLCNRALRKVDRIMSAGNSPADIRRVQQTLKRMTDAMRKYERRGRSR